MAIFLIEFSLLYPNAIPTVSKEQGDVYENTEMQSKKP